MGTQIHYFLNEYIWIFLGVRQPMTVEEVIDMYRIATPRIFQTSSKLQKILNWITNKLAGVPIYPYGQEGIGSLLDEYYGSTTLKDFEGLSNFKIVGF